jgi:hypothetical protein
MCEPIIVSPFIRWNGDVNVAIRFVRRAGSGNFVAVHFDDVA